MRFTPKRSGFSVPSHQTELKVVYVIEELLQQRIGALSIPDVDVTLADANVRVRVAVVEGRAVVEILSGFPCASLRPWLDAQVQRLLADEGIALSRLDLY